MTRAAWGGDPDASRSERLALADQAHATDAARQLQRCFAHWPQALEHLSWRALRALAANTPVDPNDPDTWITRDDAALGVLRRHGVTHINPNHLALAAITALIDGQADADRAAGLDWSTVTAPAEGLDETLARAHAHLGIDLTDPAAFAHIDAQRRALAARLGLPAARADELSRWALACPGQFDAGDLRCWRIASHTWLALADRQLEPVKAVQRPVGLFVTPAPDGHGWQLSPVLTVDMVRLIAALDGQIARDLCSATIPGPRAAELLQRLNTHTLHAGRKENLDAAGALADELTRVFAQTVAPGVPRDRRDRWGRLRASRREYANTATSARIVEIALRVATFPARDFTRRRLGAAGVDDLRLQPSATMELGEAIQSAVDRGLPLLLSTEAAGHLKDTTRVGRMKGRPGMLTITTSDGQSVSTRRVVAEQAIGALRTMKAAGTKVALDAGARQVLRMTLARPLADDPILLGRQRETAALKVVGSGVDASQVGTGKAVSTARALAARATITRRLRAMIVAEGRLLGQWRDELTRGAPGRGLTPLAPNVAVHVLDEQRPVAAQVRAFDRELGERPGVLLVANGLLDRHPADLQVIPWHLLVADEALRYANPATQAHQALRLVRMGSVADCWLLTATPRGKSAEALDVLVGLAVGDEAMITERLNTREAGDLMNELNAHRLRVNYGPHLVRVTRQDMQDWMPDVRPAQPIALEADPALARLLDAIREGGREAYRRLLEVLRELKGLQTGSELFRRALAELSRAQGVVLGNVGVYIDASVDPETLTHSRATLAQALVRQGLVAQAMRGGGDGLPLLRGVVAQTLAGVAGDEQVIVFAERVWCLRQLAGTLRDVHGVRVHVADGTVTADDFEDLKRRFCAGEFPVLCLSPVGQAGHNLQNASALAHMDLPWTPGGLEQRVGRAARPGSARASVQTYIPYIRGAGVDHIVSVLSPRGAEHHQILDGFEGVASCNSTLASQLGPITSQVATNKHRDGCAATAARLRVAAAVFGR